MSFISQEQRYNMLRDIKRGTNIESLHNRCLTAEEEEFIQDYAMQKLNETLSEPDIMAVLKRMKDR
jgi:hypothetical protein